MKIAISKKITGSDFYLITEDLGKTFLVDKKSNDSWVLFDYENPYNLNEYFESINLTIDLNVDEKYKEVLSQVTKSKSFPILSLLTEEEKKDTIKQLIVKSNNLLKKANNQYLNTFLKTQIPLKSLDTFLIDKTKALKVIKDEKTNDAQKRIITELLEFSENQRRLIYTRAKSTGRITVLDGPNVLSLQKEFRKIFKSKYYNGKILQIDFISHEPRVAAYLAKIDIEKDIHQYVSDHVFNGEISRNNCKILTMGILYGMSLLSLSEKIGSTKAAEKAIKQIRDYFKIQDLEDTISKTVKGNFFNNYYGRVISSDASESKHHLVSHYIQSTGVDVALLGFNNLIETIKKEKIDAHPFMIIHDAIYLDCSSNLEIDQLIKIKKSCETIDGFDKKFNVEIKEI